MIFTKPSALRAISRVGAVATKKHFSASTVARISFALTPEQLELQDLARNFTAKEITPKAAHHDRTGEYPVEILKK
ncbi:hypothetical protein BC830DRAFT_1165135, partial [Chytriomyces sp. MP71]